MSDEKNKTKAAATTTIKIETINGREVETNTTTGLSTYKDTGEVVKAEDREFAALLGGATLEAKGLTKQNPEVRFYSYAIRPDGHEEDLKNTIRGLVVKIDERPESFGSANDEPSVDDGDTDVARGPRVMAWILLTAECWTKTLDKKIELSKPGTMVWMDLNSSTLGLVNVAAPKYTNGVLTGLVEVMVVPKRKDQFTAQVGNRKEPRFVWRSDVFGGWKGDPGFKRLEGAMIQKIQGKLATPTLFISDAAVQRAIHAADAAGSAPQQAAALGTGQGPAPQLPAAN